MKRLLLFPICSLLALMTLSSCQKEDDTALELTRALTSELKKVTDHQSAEQAAPRIKKLNDRMRRARITLLAFNSTALARTYGSNDEYVQASIELAKEIGRVRASKPATADSPDAVDEEELLVAIGQGENGNFGQSRDALVESGKKYLENDSDEGHDNPPSYLGDCYRSAALEDALSFNPDAGSELPPPAADEDTAAPAAEPAADESAAAEEPVADEPAAEESADESASEPEEAASDDSGAPAEDDAPASDSEEPTITVDDEVSF